MRLISAAVGFFAGIVTISATTIPDGGYTVTRHSNGTQVFVPFDTSLSPFVFHVEDLAALRITNRRDLLSSSALNKLSKRRVDCWGYQLDESGIDAAYAAMLEWAGNSPDICTDPGQTRGYFYHSEAVMVYYCVNDGGKCGNADREDISYAMRQMDANCRRYEASWFGWPGSFELVGKARLGDDVCKGGMNGVPF